MSIVAILLLVVMILTALLLIAVVLLQDDGGEGLGGIFGGGSSQQVGSRGGSIITRITSLVATIFVFSALGLAWVQRTPEVDNVEAAARALAEDGASETGEAALRWWEEGDITGAESGESSGTESFLDQLIDESAIGVTGDSETPGSEQ